MQNGNTHYTLITRLNDAGVSGWEITCPQCGYRARYSIPANGQQARLEILELGDPQVHHTTDDASPADQPAAWEEWDERLDDVLVGDDLNEPEDDLSWLNLGSRLWLEELLQRLD